MVITGKEKAFLRDFYKSWGTNSSSFLLKEKEEMFSPVVTSINS